MPLIQYGPALGVGTVGENELIDFDSPDQLVETDFLERINKVLPEGFRFKSLKRLEPGAKALIKEFNRAEYSVPLDSPEIVMRGRGEPRQHTASLVGEFLARESVVVERARKDKRQQIDVRKYTVRLEADADGNRLKDCYRAYRRMAAQNRRRFWRPFMA